MELIHTNPDWFNDALNKEHQSKSVEVNGARIEYMEWGNPENQSVIMLHGTNAHAHWFKFIGAMLSDKYHFVVMSFSGMGGSDWRSFYTRDTFVEDVWGVVNDAGMDNPIIVGHSFGGMVSLITASSIILEKTFINSLNINISNLNNGIYFLSVANNSQIITERVNIVK